jgi:phage-related protein
MTLFHRHNWAEVRRYFVPPTVDVEDFEVEVKGGNATPMLQVLNGYTVVELRCDDCGDVASRRLSGDAT